MRKETELVPESNVHCLLCTRRVVLSPATQPADAVLRHYWREHSAALVDILNRHRGHEVQS